MFARLETPLSTVLPEWHRRWQECEIRARVALENKGCDMAVQQNKVSKSRRNNRRAHDSLVAANPNGPSCGHYATREVIAANDEIDMDEDAA